MSATGSEMPGTSLLDLPQDIRNRIYSYTGLIQEHSIKLVRKPASLVQHLEPWWTEYQVPTYVYQQTSSVFGVPEALLGTYCVTPIPTSIFRVCKSINVETISYFYSSNRFTKYIENADEFEIFYALPQLAIRSMTSIAIQLKIWDCPLTQSELHRSGGYCYDCGCPMSEHENDMDGIRKTGYLMPAAWKRFCRYLSQRIAPNQLRLTFICLTGELSSMKSLFKSILLLPRLRACSIKFETTESNQLRARTRARARATLLPRLQDCSINFSTIRSEQLGALAQATAQSQTMDPNCKLRSFPYLRLPAEIRQRILEQTHLNPAAENFPSSSRHLIVKSRRSQTSYKEARACCGTCSNIDVVCCCVHLSGSFSTICSCRSVPESLFLVSKQMKLEAEAVLLRSNRLDLHLNIQDAVSYLDRLSGARRSLIRHICFVFSEAELGLYLRGDLPKRVRYLVDMLRTKFNLGVLCITLDMQRNSWEWDQHYKDTLDGPDSYYGYYPIICDVVSEFMALRGKFQDFHLLAPWYSSLETLLEQQIMGPHYDSYHGNKWSKELQPHQRGELSTHKLPTWHEAVWQAWVNQHAVGNEHNRDISTSTLLWSVLNKGQDA